MTRLSIAGKVADNQTIPGVAQIIAGAISPQLQGLRVKAGDMRQIADHGCPAICVDAVAIALETVPAP